MGILLQNISDGNRIGQGPVRPDVFEELLRELEQLIIKGDKAVEQYEKEHNLQCVDDISSALDDIITQAFEGGDHIWIDLEVIEDLMTFVNIPRPTGTISKQYAQLEIPSVKDVLSKAIEYHKAKVDLYKGATHENNPVRYCVDCLLFRW